jgi:methyl-accepting chemotaxis protein
MANLNALNQKVAGLSKTQSNDFEFIDVLDEIEEAAETADDEIDKLRNILDRFRLKLPNRETLDGERVRAKDLAEALMLDTVAERLDRINARNDALSALNKALQSQIAKANSDANRLKEIREAVEKATKTVEEIKGLISQLTATDSSVKEKLEALIERLGNISSIFEPQNA